MNYSEAATDWREELYQTMNLFGTTARTEAFHAFANKMESYIAAKEAATTARERARCVGILERHKYQDPDNPYRRGYNDALKSVLKAIIAPTE